MLTIQKKKFVLTESSNPILFVNMLQIWNLRYSRHFWIIKHIGLEPIIFSINMNDASSYIVFSTFDCVSIYKFISFQKKKKHHSILFLHKFILIGTYTANPFPSLCYFELLTI